MFAPGRRHPVTRAMPRPSPAIGRRCKAIWTAIVTGQRPELVLLHKNSLTPRRRAALAGFETRIITSPHSRSRRYRATGAIASPATVWAWCCQAVAREDLLTSACCEHSAKPASPSTPSAAPASARSLPRAMHWSGVTKNCRQRVRRSFVDTNPVDDYTLPLVSLVSGRKVSRLIRNEVRRCGHRRSAAALFLRLHQSQLGTTRRASSWAAVALAARFSVHSRRVAADHREW